jgi:hypothetical protein
VVDATYFMTRLVRPDGLVVVDDMWMPAVRTAVAYVDQNLGVTLAPDALPNAFRWRRRPLSSGVPSGTGDMAVLRLPGKRPELRGTSSCRRTEPRRYLESCVRPRGVVASTAPFQGAGASSILVGATTRGSASRGA